MKSLLALALCLAATSLMAEERTPKAIILGIDGCRTDALLAAKTPHLQQLIAEGVFATNNTVLGNRPTTADTISGPGWSSILTGVWPDKHGVLDNTFRPSNYEQYPNVLRLLKRVRPDAETAALLNWKPLADFVFTEKDGGLLTMDGDQHDYARADQTTADAAVELLSKGNPDLLFVYLGQVDVAGHGHGFHPQVPQYLEALATVDRHVGQIMTAVRKRPTFAQEDWLIVVCTDHGGRGTRHGGGHEAPEVRTTFLIVHGPSVTPARLEEPTANVDVVATVLAHLGVTPPAEWKLDGRPLGLSQ